MAVSTISKEFITKSFSHTFPAFSAGATGTRIDYWTPEIEVSGYTPKFATLTPMIGGVTFIANVSIDPNLGKAIVTRNRALNNAAEPNTYPCTLYVLYQKN